MADMVGVFGFRSSVQALGISAANEECFCIHCKCTKKEINDLSLHWTVSRNQVCVFLFFFNSHCF